MDFSTDEYFGTLGGSLMKDLLADLQVEDGDFSLEQLEKELAQLDHETPQMQPQPLPTLDAASLVVSHAQQRSGPAAPGMTQVSQPMDAWSLSLQNFTAMSLQDDFLAADSAKKQREQHPFPMNSMLPPGVLDAAEDYDVAEKQSLAPPPGLGGPPGLVPPATKPANASSNPKEFPRTPQNSLVISEDDAQAAAQILQKKDVEKSAAGAPPPGSMPPVAELPKTAQAAPATQATITQPGIVQGVMTPPGVLPQQQGVVPSKQENVAPAAIPHAPMMVPGHPNALQGIPVAQPGHMPPKGPMPPPQAGQIPMAPHKIPPHAGVMMPPPGGMPVPVGMPPMGPAWQHARPPAPPAIRAFCNSHPAAPPIPATALEAKFMSARDIAYVIHSIMKPVLAEGTSEDSYHIQFLRRIGGAQANPMKPKAPKDINEEMMSRANKTKEWASEKGVLGHVAKTNVARPRALIATPQAPSEQDSEQKQRASLWKARIYCDQAYQSYQAVVETWRSAPPGGVPPQVQMHLVKLMKCMGLTLVEKDYQIDDESLKLLIKLGKGRTLISRVLEQALLPPNAALALVPHVLDSLLTLCRKSDESKVDDPTNERLFRGITGVLQKLNTTSETLLSCIAVVQKSGKVALASTARMECVHTLLQKGSVTLGQDPSEATRAAWGKAENDFMTLLQAF